MHIDLELHEFGGWITVVLNVNCKVKIQTKLQATTTNENVFTKIESESEIEENHSQVKFEESGFRWVFRTLVYYVCFVKHTNEVIKRFFENNCKKGFENKMWREIKFS